MGAPPSGLEMGRKSLVQLIVELSQIVGSESAKIRKPEGGHKKKFFLNNICPIEPTPFPIRQNRIELAAQRDAPIGRGPRRRNRNRPRRVVEIPTEK
jgi:hypothetical protein